jgi:hypothetical protein
MLGNVIASSLSGVDGGLAALECTLTMLGEATIDICGMLEGVFSGLVYTLLVSYVILDIVSGKFVSIVLLLVGNSSWVRLVVSMVAYGSPSVVP